MNHKQLKLKEYLSILGILLCAITYLSNLPVSTPSQLLLPLLLPPQRPIMLYFAYLDTTYGERSKINQTYKIIENKPNLRDAQINVSSVLTKDYENDNAFRPMKTKPIQSQYKAKTNPTCRGVASGEAGFKPDTQKRNSNGG